MAQKNIEWIIGSPDSLEPGMVVMLSGYHEDGDLALVLIGCDIPSDAQQIVDEHCVKWGRIIQPHELQWIASMAAMGSPPAR